MEYRVKDKNLDKNNISVSLEKMENTELRCRIKLEDMSLCNITKSGKVLSWQNSHFHKNCSELYLVQKGKILIVTKEENKVLKKFIQKGEVLLVEPNISHNVYLYEDSVICTLKYGGNEYMDWYEDRELDKVCKSINLKKVAVFD